MISDVPVFYAIKNVKWLGFETEIFRIWGEGLNR